MRHGGRVHRQCLGPEYTDGLSAPSCDRPFGRNTDSPPADPVRGGFGRVLRGRCFFARLRLSGIFAAEGGVRCAAFRRCLRGPEALSSADASFLCRVLRICRLCAGAGADRRRRSSVRPRDLLHGCQRPGPADLGNGRIRGIQRGVPGRSQARRRRRRIGEDPHQPGGPQCGADGPAGYGLRPAGPHQRAAGTGGGSRGPARALAGAFGSAFKRPDPAGSGLCAGAAAGGRGSGKVPADDVPDGGAAGEPSFGLSQHMHLDRRTAASGAAGCAVAQRIGRWICRFMGRNFRERRGTQCLQGFGPGCAGC